MQEGQKEWKMKEEKANSLYRVWPCSGCFVLLFSGTVHLYIVLLAYTAFYFVLVLLFCYGFIFFT